jgi:hypothetical protein
MKYVTWLEIILVGTILAASLAATVIARKTVERVRAGDAPEEKAFLGQQQIERHERLLARKRAGLDRVQEKLIDARAAVPANAALVTHLEQYLARADEAVSNAETDLARRRKTAAAAFRKARRSYDWNTRVIALRCAAGSAIILFLTTLTLVSLPNVRRRLPVHRGLLVGAVLASLPLLVVYELFQEAGLVLAAAVAVFALVIVIARATPAQEHQA